MGHTRWLSEDEMRAWLAFMPAATLVGRELDRQLKEDTGLSHLQYEILIHLDEARQGAMRMTELAERLVNSKSGLTYQIGQMEKAGLVTRRQCEWSKSGVLAEITPEGRAMLERAAPGHVDKVREILIDVLTPEERRAIAEGLGRVRDRIIERNDGEACW
ncbi:MarR family transcriptional regulator [Glycomyces sp. TRM65418]|uniref:MarR family winged helix-turn-helix transcriptional regulator n=1 Tax=Glycomyces sp. TRM65418 TaxID=2867006 RepID=UPI001CE5037D|nr:MarR family transcriptional regulator [Glycomyces sp. TRM65418]MCC3763442.1 MarR family transcriptional regulator [Glycomyces sp. TRM65418]QZD57431.1 MarR family transcriptional regulator [Glycomyces sp. TRM65418]